MYKLFSYAFVLVIIASCGGNDKKEFEVSGNIKNAKTSMVYLQETPLASGQRIIVDSSVIGKDGAYHLKGKKGEETLFHLIAPGEVYPFAVIVNDASKIKVDADLSQPNDYTVDGSPGSESIKEFSKTASGKWLQLNTIGAQYDSLQKSGAPDTALVDINMRGQKLLADMKDYIKNFVTNSKSPVASILALASYPQLFSATEYPELLNDVVKKFPDHKGLAAVKEMNDRQMTLAKQKGQAPDLTEWIGKEAPEITMPDVNGKEVKLSSFRGKYVLVDFWASWCGPCRKENPNVVAAFNKYKNKNFTILGVSLDSDKADWVAAIQRDQLEWTQISDLKEWSSEAVPLYNIQGIPFNVLLDPSGKVIGESLRGAELERKLEEVLK